MPTHPLPEKVSFVLEALTRWGIPFQLHEHPPLPTIEDAQAYWKDIDAQHCKNLFMRNHKGNKHYLISYDWNKTFPIHDLEHKLHQGKLSFASAERMAKYLGVTPGSVSPFGLLNDTEHHVYVYLDAKLQDASKITFHPNDNRYTVEMAFPDFLRYMALTGNAYEFINLDRM